MEGMQNGPQSLAMAQMGADINSVTEAQAVGEQFVTQYYTVLRKQPHMLHRFYTEHSTVTYCEPGVPPQVIGTQQNIHQKVMTLGYQDAEAITMSVDAQYSLEQGVIVQVTGTLQTLGGPVRNFVQTFFLAVQAKGYFVLNDVLRILPIPAPPIVPPQLQYLPLPNPPQQNGFSLPAAQLHPPQQQAQPRHSDHSPELNGQHYQQAAHSQPFLPPSQVHQHQQLPSEQPHHRPPHQQQQYPRAAVEQQLPQQPARDEQSLPQQPRVDQSLQHARGDLPLQQVRGELEHPQRQSQPAQPPLHHAPSPAYPHEASSEIAAAAAAVVEDSQRPQAAPPQASQPAEPAAEEVAPTEQQLEAAPRQQHAQPEAQPEPKANTAPAVPLTYAERLKQGATKAGPAPAQGRPTGRPAAPPQQSPQPQPIQTQSIQSQTVQTQPALTQPTQTQTQPSRAASGPTAQGQDAGNTANSPQDSGPPSQPAAPPPAYSQDTQGGSVFVKDLPADITLERLTQAFEEIGPLSSSGRAVTLKVQKDKAPFAFVEFASSQSAETAIKGPVLIDGHQVRVDDKKPHYMLNRNSRGNYGRGGYGDGGRGGRGYGDGGRGGNYGGRGNRGGHQGGRGDMGSRNNSGYLSSEGGRGRGPPRGGRGGGRNSGGRGGRGPPPMGPGDAPNTEAARSSGGPAPDSETQQQP